MANVKLVALSGSQLVETTVLIDDATGQITLPTTTPVNPDHVATKYYVDAKVGGYVTDAELDAWLANLATATEVGQLEDLIDTKADASALTSLSADVLHLGGGTMSGPILWSGTPTSGPTLVNKTYVDSVISTAASGLMTKAQADASYLALAGGTVTGPITLAGNPTLELQAAPKQYVDAGKLTASDYLPVAGGTMVGALTLSSATPSSDLEAVSKQYVDSFFDARASGLKTYYDNGAIPIHLSRMFMVYDPADTTKVRGWRNRGGGGAKYDAVVRDAAASIPYNSTTGLLSFSSSTIEPPILKEAISLKNKRLFFVMVYPSPSGTPNIFGGREFYSTTLPNGGMCSLRIQGTTTACFLFSDAESGTWTAKALTGYYSTALYEVPTLYEFIPDYRTRRGEIYFNGLWKGGNTMTANDTDFTLKYIAGVETDSGTFTSINANINEVLVVDDEHPDAAAAVTLVRSYVCRMYGITNGVSPVEAMPPDESEDNG